MAKAQISPGALARPHQLFEGTLQCVKCHAGGRGDGKEQMTGLCLNCHKEIAWLSERGRGLHGSPAVKPQRCASCHPEHAGVDFAMVSWEGQGGSVERFEHARAGWPLEGSHARQKCADCHWSDSYLYRRCNLGAGATMSRRDEHYISICYGCQR